MQIKQNTVLITGGGSGMGLATALQLKALGARVFLVDQNVAALKAQHEQHGFSYFEADVTSEAAIEAVFKTLKANNQIPRIVVQCAGIAPGKKILGKEGAHDFALFKKTLDVNLAGTFLVLKTAAFYMKDLPILGESRGIVINTASIAAFEGQIGQVAYSASKGGIVAMTLPAARELAQQAIRVMAIAPGLVETPLLMGLSDAVKNELPNAIPFPKRLAQPEEFAKLVIAIIENEYLNGETIRLDGGLRMTER